MGITAGMQSSGFGMCLIKGRMAASRSLPGTSIGRRESVKVRFLFSVIFLVYI